MSDLKSVLDRGLRGFEPSDDAFERTLRRRDRKRRNQRIAAGVVGLAVFVFAIWMVASVSSLDRGEESVAPAGNVTGPGETAPAETGPAETTPPPALASAAPDEVRQRTCSNGAGSRLELTDIGDRIKVRFEVHRSPPGHLWQIRMWRNVALDPGHDRRMFRGARVASDSGDFAVVRLTPDLTGPNSGGSLVVRVEANDPATGQVCEVEAFIPPF